jgi:ferritin-like metal-binding protein YciE
MNKSRDILIVGLRNAHAMEIQARELMERQSERLTEYPEVQGKVRHHLRETHEQLSRIEQCLDTLGESPSTIKDTVQSVAANAMGMAHAFADDEILKNTFANNAFENFEIAAYTSLITLAADSGHREIIPLLQQSLTEEKSMADWVASSVEKITLAYIRQSEREAVT